MTENNEYNHFDKDRFDFERKTSKSWNKFLFEFSLMNIERSNILTKHYDENTFGSWFIELSEKRFIYDGKDYIFIKQSLKNKIWTDEKSIKNEDLNYSNFMSLLNH